ncbi:MAG: hypothetical protein SCH39_01835 [Methanosarcinales archaeon]|nr:hypothetical protein [ANME-2 cluster archaeon]MDW7775059.1 hypothetical protein [Methanosarcinales archaeon]
MKKPHRKPKKITQNKSDIDWILEIIRTFKPVHLQLRSYYILLVKLLDYLKKEDFSGCLFIHVDETISIFSMWRGELIGIINNKLDVSDEEAFRYVLGNYQNAIIDIYQSPEGKESLPLLLNSIAKKDLEPIYKDLDTEFTDLSKLIYKLVQEKLVGYVELKLSEGRYIACYHRGEEILTVYLDKNNKHTASTPDKMCKQNGIVNIYKSKVRTLVNSMEDAMKRITVLALTVDESQPTLHTIVVEFKGHISLNLAEAARNNVDLTISLPAGLANRDDSEIFKVQVTKTPEFEFVKYLLSDFFLNIAESGNSATLKNIWMNIPRVKVIKFSQTYHEGHVEHKFDVVIEDGSDNVLFATRITNKITKSYEVDVFLKELENIKENKNEWNSLRAGFLLSTKGFEDDAISAARKDTGTNAGVKKVLGKVYGSKVPDVLVNPIGFVKTANKGGFHLVLIHLENNIFKVIFPDL